MNVFVTPPLKHLELSELGDHNFYVLAQLYKNNEAYREYVHKAKKQSRFIICDNGAGDEGEVVQKEELYEIMKEIQPNEIIPTDTLYDSYQTLSDFHWFVRKMTNENINNVKILACPQGNDLKEYLRCYKIMEDNEKVSTIGWSKKTLPFVIYKDNQKDQNIAEARNYFYLKRQNLLQKPVHCLGMGDPQEFLLYNRNRLMRSTDSCYAILAAINNIDLSKNFKRVPTPADYFDMELNSTQIELAKKNVEFIKNCCYPIRF